MILPSATNDAKFQPIKTSMLEEAPPPFEVEAGLDEDTDVIWRVVMGWEDEEDVVVSLGTLVLVPVLLPVLVTLEVVVFPVVGSEEVRLPVELVLDEETELEVGLSVMVKVTVFA